MVGRQVPEGYAEETIADVALAVGDIVTVFIKASDVLIGK